jgi:hypothetical protein
MAIAGFQPRRGIVSARKAHPKCERRIVASDQFARGQGPDEAQELKFQRLPLITMAP